MNNVFLQKQFAKNIHSLIAKQKKKKIFRRKVNSKMLFFSKAPNIKIFEKKKNKKKKKKKPTKNNLTENEQKFFL